MVDSFDLLCLGRYAVVRPGHRFGYIRALSGIIFLSALVCVSGQGLVLISMDVNYIWMEQNRALSLLHILNLKDL